MKASNTLEFGNLGNPRTPKIDLVSLILSLITFRFLSYCAIEAFPFAITPGADIFNLFFLQLRFCVITCQQTHKNTTKQAN